jgi:hypothetical protein
MTNNSGIQGFTSEDMINSLANRANVSSYAEQIKGDLVATQDALALSQDSKAKLEDIIVKLAAKKETLTKLLSLLGA